MRARIGLFSRAFFLVSIVSFFAFTGPTMAQGGPPGGGAGTAPVADAGRDHTVEYNGVDPVTVVLDGTGTIDGDGQQLTDDDPATPYGITWSFVSKPAGSAAVLSDDQVIRPTFVIDQAGDYVIQLVADDGTDVSTDTVTISTDSSAPHADAGRDRKVAVNDTVVLDGSGSSDWDGDALTYSWSVTGPGGAVTLSDPNAVMPSFLVDQAGEYTATLTVSDGTHTSEADQVLVSTVNVPPAAVANAGEDTVIPTGLNLNTLDAEGTSDLDGDALSYRWSLLWGPPGGGYSLADETERRAAMSTVNATGDWVVQLTVDDGTDASSTTFLLAATTNIAPRANAGADQSIAVGQAVTLDGTGSTDNDQDEIAYRWALIHKPAGSAAVLDDPTAGRPRFTVDLAGTYVAQLIVNDGATDSLPDTVVASSDENLTPVADAGIDYFQQGLNNTIQLDGTGSADPNGDALTYRWTMLDRAVRSAAVLSDPASPTPTFVADKTGIYVIQLVVSDGVTESAPDIVMISAKGQGGTVDVNLRPIADGGAAVMQTDPGLVQLDGSGSINPNDPNPISMTYHWALIHRPAGSAAVLSDPNAIDPTFTTDVPGLYVAQLMVHDGVMYSIPDIAVTRLNAPPVADAGLDQDGYVDQAVALDGTGSSDPDGDPITYAWSFAAKPTGSLATLTGATTATPGFTPDVFGDYVVQLVVNDGIADSAPDSVTVSMINRAPVAEAGPEQSAIAGTLVQLDGSGSSDVDHQALTYSWRFTAKPAGSLAALSDPAIINPTFTADVEGLYVAELTVNDGIADSAPDTVGVRAGSGVVNTAPVLGAVGPQTVELGSTLTVTLSATDADGDPYSFFATPLPLPAGASLDSASGAFTFRPDETQVGVHTITFGVSDGLDSDSESVSITVTAPQPGTVTTLAARVLDANDLAIGVETPVVNANVVIRAQSPSPGVFGAIVAGPTTTDALGNFTLTNIPGNAALIDIDGTVADLAPDGTAYMQAYEELALIADAVNVPAEPYALARLDAASATTYTPGVETVVTNTALNTTVTIAATTTVTNLDGSPFAGTFTVSEIPSSEVADLLPAYVTPCSVITFQSEPSKVNFSEVASYTLGNLDGLPAGSVVDVWGIARSEGKFMIVGTGTVTADGLSIIPSNGLGGTPALFFATPRAPTAVAAIDMNGVNRRPTLLGDGNLSQALSLPGYQWLGREQQTTFVYNSATANLRPVAATEVTFPADSGMPGLLEGRLIVGGNEVAGPVYTSTAGYTDPETGEVRPDLVAGQPIRQALQFDASNLPTGSYPYRYVATSKYTCSKVGAAVDGRLLVDNQEDSPFGAGWTLDGLHRITQQNDERLVLEDGAGTTTVFDPVLAETAISFDDFSDLARFNLNGSAATINATPVTYGGTNVLRMTNALWQSGSAFLDEAVPLEFEGGTLSFSSEFTFQFTNSSGISDGDGIGADGITFAIVNAPTVTGGQGAGIGYGGITPSIAVEFDTYRNGPINYPNIADPDGNHVGIDINGSLKSVVTAPVSPRMNNGAVWYAWVDYIGSSKTLEVRLAQTPDRPANPKITRVVDIPATIGSTTAYMGFTSGTGAASNDHDIRSWKVRVFGDNFDVAYSSPVSDFSVLAKNVDGTLTRTMKDGVIMEFDANGRQTAEIDPNGNTTSYLYDAQGRLYQIVRTPGDLTTTFVYNAAGQLENVTDPAGRVTSYAYDPLGTLLSVTYPDGSIVRYRYVDDSKQMSDVASARGYVTTHSYDFAGQWVGASFPDGTSISASISGAVGLPELGTEANPGTYVLPEDRVSTLTDAKGNRYEMEVNQYGSIIRLTDPIARVNRYERDENNLTFRIRKPTDSDPSGEAITEIDWDVRGNVIAQREAVGTALERQTRYEYEPTFNRVVKTIDPSNSDPAPACATIGVTCFTYDEFGKPLSTTDPAGGVKSFTYDARGLPLTATDANGNVTNFAYDLIGRLTTITDAAGSITSLDYDSAGNKVSETEADGTPEARTTTYTYDAMGRITSEMDPAGAVTEYTYDAEGNQIVATGDTGASSTSTYDEMSRITAVTDPDSGTVSRAYDENGNITSMIDPTGNITHFAYDAVNRRVGVEDPELGVRQISYDAQDNPIQVIGARGFPINFAYDVLGQQTSQTNALGASWSNTFDAVGNLISEADAKGQTKTHTYDAANRLVGITAKRADGTTADTISFTYDAAGNPLTASDSDSSLAWTYDALNRAATASTVGETFTVQPAVTLTNLYDAVGYRRQLQATSGLTALGTTFYDYDLDGALLRVITPAGEVIDLSYDSLARRTGISWASSASTKLTYGPSYERPEEILHAFGTTELARLSYSYEIDGRMSSATEPGGVRNFIYDGNQQLTSAGFAAAPESYAYDAEGNRTSSHLSASYAYDDANRLTEDDAWCYGYDPNGNLSTKTAKVAGACTGNVTTYTWDVFDRLTRIDFPDATYAAYRYDAQGRRIEKDINGVITRYVYDGDNIVLEFDGANALAARYSHDAEIDRPLAMERAGTSHAYHADERGSVRLVTDGAGTVVNRYDYDAFGNWESTSYETVANSFAFNGREWDAESGLYFYRARYYDPQVGRFISQDPLGIEAGDFTLYAYVFNDPQNLDDPTGMLVEFGGLSCFSSNMGSLGGGIFGAIAETIIAHVVHALDSGHPSTSEEVLGEAATNAASVAGTNLTGAAAGCGTSTVKPPPGKFVRYMTQGEIRAIRRTGLLRGGNPGRTYITRKMYDGANQARRRLALPTRPTHRVVFTIKNTPRLHGPTRVPPKYNQPGGGTQIFSYDAIEVFVVSIKRLKP